MTDSTSARMAGLVVRLMMAHRFQDAHAVAQARLAYLHHKGVRLSP